MRTSAAQAAHSVRCFFPAASPACSVSVLFTAVLLLLLLLLFVYRHAFTHRPLSDSASQSVCSNVGWLFSHTQRRVKHVGPFGAGGVPVADVVFGDVCGVDAEAECVVVDGCCGHGGVLPAKAGQGFPRRSTRWCVYVYFSVPQCVIPVVAAASPLIGIVALVGRVGLRVCAVYVLQGDHGRRRSCGKRALKTSTSCGLCCSRNVTC